MICFSCKKSDRDESGKVLAQVGDHTLYESALPNIVSENSSTVDSIALINGIVEQWIRKHVLVDAAEASLSSTINIESLLEDYRSSLLISNFEQQYIENNLDTTVTTEQLEEEFSTVGSNFKLSEPIFKIKIAKVDNKMTGLEGFYTNWKAGKTQKVKKYCEERALYYSLDNEWMTLSEIRQNIPSSLLTDSQLMKKQNFQKYSGGFEYFVKIMDYHNVDSPPPLSYIQYKIRELVIHRRKKEMLEKLESDLYTKAINTNKIKVYNK